MYTCVSSTVTTEINIWGSVCRQLHNMKKLKYHQNTSIIYITDRKKGSLKFIIANIKFYICL